MTRMISFRVSEHEFELLKTKSEAVGARSVSDYARVALCGSAGAGDAQAETDIHHLSDGMQQLSLEIRRLFDLLEGPRGSYSEGHSIASNHNEGVGNV
jgi:hypothetical protein